MNPKTIIYGRVLIGVIVIAACVLLLLSNSASVGL